MVKKFGSISLISPLDSTSFLYILNFIPRVFVTIQRNFYFMEKWLLQQLHFRPQLEFIKLGFSPLNSISKPSIAGTLFFLHVSI